MPVDFELAKSKYANHILNFGFIETKDDYFRKIKIGTRIEDINGSNNYEDISNLVYESQIEHAAVLKHYKYFKNYKFNSDPYINITPTDPSKNENDSYITIGDLSYNTDNTINIKVNNLDISRNNLNSKYDVLNTEIDRFYGFSITNHPDNSISKDIDSSYQSILINLSAEVVNAFP